MRKKLGILGGMGPLASAAFLQTIYRLNIVEPEQEAPLCLLLSDPTFPDRTTAILAGETGPLVERLTRALQDLLDLGANRIVIACVTVHHVLSEVPEPLRKKVVSLLDLFADEILAAPRPRLLLATTGTRTARIFESHERWPEIAPWVIFPGEDDQRQLHDHLYRMKKGEPGDAFLAWLDTLPAKYGAQGFLFGCTELHLLQPLLGDRAGDGSIVDPLLTAARDVDKLLA
jgi:aspartate racemase